MAVPFGSCDARASKIGNRGRVGATVRDVLYKREEKVMIARLLCKREERVMAACLVKTIALYMHLSLNS